MTPTEVLVVDWRPREFDGVAERFPEVQLHVVESWAEAEPHLATAEVLVTVGRSFTPAIAARMPALSWCQSMVSGIDRILATLTDRSEVLITTARGIHGPQMSEAALYHMLCLSRDVRRSVHAQDDARYETWDPRTLHGRAVGVVGVGAAGAHVARACKALGMTVVGVSRTPRAVDGFDRIVAREQLADAAAEVDFLVLTLPLDESARHIVDARILRAMKPTAYLVNLARGGNVDTKALIDALRTRSIAGAGLDAFDEEPLPPEHPLWQLDNVFLTAHRAGRSDRYVEGLLEVFEPNLRRWLDGERDELVNVVER